MALSRPRTTRRVLRGSALGIGLLVAGGVTAPAAFAVEDTTTGEVPAESAESPTPLREAPTGETPVLAPALEGDFGTGKDFTVQVQPYGPVPDDLDLSGAVFQATPVVTDDVVTLADDPVTYTCTTDVGGACTFSTTWGWEPGDFFPMALTAEGSGATLPTGQYTLTQELASPGLAPAAGSATFGLCSFPVGCGPESDGTQWADVGNDSLFRTSLVTTVTDVDTAEPLACAGYELSGPDYPHDGTAVPAEPVTGDVPEVCASEPTSTETPADPTTSAAPSSSAPVTTDETDPATDTESPTSTGTSSPSTTSPTTDSPVLDLAAEDTPLVLFGTQVSDLTGTMTFPGWFLPGDGYLLTPTATPAGYAADVTDAFSIRTTAVEAAGLEPARVLRALGAGLSGASPAPGGTGGVASAATTTAAAATTSAPAAAATDPAALAVTGTPVGSMVLLGGGLVALGGGALAAGGVLRRRARRSA